MDFNFGPGAEEIRGFRVFSGVSTVQTGNNAAHVLRSECEDRKIEVMIEGDDKVALRYSTWIDGLGWCSQKTIRLDADQLEDLHHAVTVARHRLNRRRADAGLPTETAQVIQLPKIA